MTDRTKTINQWAYPATDNWELDLPLIISDETFTRSNGTIVSRLYERLTKASRRTQDRHLSSLVDAEEKAYRQGLYDAFKALQKELSS